MTVKIRFVSCGTRKKMSLNEWLIIIQIMTGILFTKFGTPSAFKRKYAATLNDNSLPECATQFDKRKCFLRHPENLVWEEAHEFCRTNGGFLPEENDLRQNDFPEEKIWTALTDVEGFHQWVSRTPAIYQGKIRELFPSTCILYNVRSKNFTSTACKTHYPFVCVVDITLEATLRKNVVMQITANYRDESKWIELDTEDFSKLKLNCSAYDINKKNDVEYLKVIWRKDNIWTGWDSTTIQPTNFEPPLQNEILIDTIQSILLKKQGTYCCEAWEPYSIDMVKHDCFLVTLKEITTFAVASSSNNAYPSIDGYPGTKPKDPLDLPQCSLRQETISPISLKIDSTGNKLKYNIYVKGFTKNDIIPFSDCENFGGKTFKFVTNCFAKNYTLKYGNKLQFPSSRAGYFYESDFKCEKENNTLAFQRCQWSSIDGAEISPSTNVHERLCQRLDQCPKPFKIIAETMCVQIIKNVTWEEGFVLLYQTGSEKTLFDDRWFHNPILESSVTHLFEYLSDEEVYDVWLPLKRNYPFTPLINQDINSSGDSVSIFPKPEYPDTKLNWTKLHPIGSKTCVVHNIDSRTSYSDDCHMRYNVVRILDIPTKEQLSTIASNGATLCEKDWYRVILNANEQVCIKAFQDEKLFSWKEAEDFCISQNAHLVNPTRGFMDWIIRSFLTENQSAWINIRKFMISPKFQFEFINWLPETNFDKEYGIISNEGWTMIDEPIETPHIVICEKKIEEHAQLKLLIEETNYNSICVIVTPRKLLRSDSIKCQKNGEIIELNCTNLQDCDCMFEIDKYGYYECTAWSLFPTERVRSNIITKSRKIHNYVVIGTHNSELYKPFIYDSTYFNPRSSKLGSICSNTIRKSFNTHDFLNNPRVYYYSDKEGKFQYSLHVPCNFSNQSICFSEKELQKELSSILSEDPIVSGVCSVEKVRSTVGCPNFEEYFSENFRWLETNIAGRFIPIEICILNDGLPMSRICEGNYISGYHWLQPASVNCSKAPSVVSQQLWDFHNDPLRHLQEGRLSLANLTKDSNSLIASNVVSVQLIFEEIVDDPMNGTSINFEEAVSTMNNVMGANLSTLRKAQDNFGSVSSIVNNFESSNFLTSSNGTQKIASKERLSVSVIEISPKISIIGHQFGRSSNKDLSNENEIDEPNLEAAIILSETFVQRIKQNLNNSGTQLPKAPQLQFISYNETKFFIDSTREEQQINSAVIKVSYDGPDSAQDLFENESITIIFRVKPNEESICGQYDFQKNNGKGGWTEGGCEIIECKNNLVVAKGYRLAHFALLFKNNGTSCAHYKALSIISIIGCSLSIIGLTLVLITFCAFQKFRKDLRNKILASLSLAILISLVLFLFSNSLKNNSCQALAFFLDYFILASFGWMFVEAIHNYLQFVKVIYNPISRFFQKVSCFGWGMPVIPIAVALIISKGKLHNEESGHEMCWLSYDVFIYTFVPIVALVTIANTFIYVIIVHTVFLKKRDLNSMTNSQSDFVKAKICMSICVFFLLGLTWMFGFLTIGEGQIVFTYLFCIFNTAQGFFIFILYIFKNKKTRKLWLERFKIDTSLTKRWPLLRHVLHPSKEPQIKGVNFSSDKSSTDESSI